MDTPTRPPSTDRHVVADITASVIVFSMDAKSVCLVFHKKLQMWLYPGGHLLRGEDLAQCAIREVKEETGLDVQLATHNRPAIDLPEGSHVGILANPFAILRIEDEPPYTDVVFLATADRGQQMTPNQREVDEARWVELNSLESLPMPTELPHLMKLAKRILDATLRDRPV
jgi:8-oxo-dGTP diphosphatase